MAKKKRKKNKGMRKHVNAVMRHNPGVISVVKTVAPGAGSFIVTALASAQLPKILPVVNATEKRQKIAGLILSLGAGAGVLALARRNDFVARNKISLLAGIGVSVLLQLIRIFISPKNPLLHMPVQQRATGEVYDDQATTWVTPGVTTGRSDAATINALEDEVMEEMDGDENWSF